MKNTITLFSAALLSSSFAFAGEQTTVSTTDSTDAIKVLYVTHEPGRWHRYTPQREIFEKIAKEQNWKLKVLSGSQDDVVTKLATEKDFGKGADVIVYNFCLAKKEKLDVPHNIITQTKDKGIPALLIHCSLHSFWATYDHGGGVHPEGANQKAKAKKELVAEWKESHPGVEFPAWSNMTGIASKRHGPRKPIEAKPLDATHPCFKGVETYTTHEQAELYNNIFTAEDSPETTSLMEGTQGNAKASILWEHPLGKSKTISFTLGHGLGEWEQEPFQKILANSVEYLATGK